nr:MULTISPECIES: hypothetical protein [unclassified Ruegeria]
MAHPTDSSERKNIGIVAFTIAGLLTILLGIFGLFGKSDWNPFVSAAEGTAQDIAKASIGVYVSLRAINAALSTAQEIEVGASVVGQASLQPLKVLEPVDDTVERVADVVFLVATGAALAGVGLAPVVSVGLIVLGAGLLGKLGFRNYPTFARVLRPICDKGVTIGLAVGLAIPLMFVLGVWIGERATAAQMNAAVEELDSVARQASVLIGAGATDTQEISEADAEATGVLAWLSDQFAGVRDGVSSVFEQSTQYLDAAQVFVDEADTILEASLTIIGIFALRLLIMPVLLFVGAIALLRTLQRRVP